MIRFVLNLYLVLEIDFYLIGIRRLAVYANYIGPSVMTDANCEGFSIFDYRITENDRCVRKIIGIHWARPAKHCFVKHL